MYVNLRPLIARGLICLGLVGMQACGGGDQELEEPVENTEENQNLGNEGEDFQDNENFNNLGQNNLGDQDNLGGQDNFDSQDNFDNQDDELLGEQGQNQLDENGDNFGDPSNDGTDEGSAENLALTPAPEPAIDMVPAPAPAMDSGDAAGRVVRFVAADQTPVYDQPSGQVISHLHQGNPVVGMDQGDGWFQMTPGRFVETGALSEKITPTKRNTDNEWAPAGQPMVGQPTSQEVLVDPALIPGT